ITHCRYGLHSMYGLNINFIANTVKDNLLGLALMYSKVLVAKHNLILEHRRGTSPYGFLLKDIDNVTIEDNLIEANQIGIFADGISMQLGSSSDIQHNTIVGNICGISVQSSAKFSFDGNNMLENLTDVTKQGEHINANVKWTAGKQGNYWSSYRGYDKNRDGIGDLPYRVEQIAELDIDPHSPSQALLYTPGYLVLESATRLFPIFKGEPILIDSAPMISPKLITQAVENSGNRSIIFSGLSALVVLGGSFSIICYKPFDKEAIS
ncbi:MAG TPA: NosD domain-containing protein, partial [Candidatus Kapabacteria bacterium]|nr:NosD domain-containing protein [Candidatus Kapabacteria bacterium]